MRRCTLPRARSRRCARADFVRPGSAPGADRLDDRGRSAPSQETPVNLPEHTPIADERLAAILARLHAAARSGAVAELPPGTNPPEPAETIERRLAEGWFSSVEARWRAVGPP